MVPCCIHYGVRKGLQQRQNEVIGMLRTSALIALLSSSNVNLRHLGFPCLLAFSRVSDVESQRCYQGRVGRLTVVWLTVTFGSAPITFPVGIVDISPPPRYIRHTLLWPTIRIRTRCFQEGSSPTI
jgi:hypothetical protein